MASKVTRSGTASKASRAKRENAFMAGATARPLYSSSGPAQHTRSDTTLASATPRVIAYMTASKSVVTEIERAAPDSSTHNDDDYVYIGVPREEMAPVNNGFTETVQRQVSLSAGPQNAAPVLHSAGTRVTAMA